MPFEFRPNPKDPELEAKLRAEWPGILRWLIEGCLDWQRHGLVRPPVVLRATEEYFAQQDYFGRWLAECCLLDPVLSARPSQLLQSCQQWCHSNGEAPPDSGRFRGMVERTPGLRYATNKGVQWVRGIGLRPSGAAGEGFCGRGGGGVEGGGP